MIAIVKFDRSVADDTEVAKINFPKISPKKRLAKQFLFELEANTNLKDYSLLLTKQNKESFYVWVAFEWNGTATDLQRELQRTYDKYGMAGQFSILDITKLENPNERSRIPAKAIRRKSG